MKEKLVSRNCIIIDTIVFIAFFITFFTFVFTLADSDEIVFQSAARQSTFLSNNIFKQALYGWELKGIANRFIFVALYRITSIFTKFNSISFAIIFKIIYGILVYVVCLMIIYNMSLKHLVKLSMLLSIAFYSTESFAHLQTEMTSSLLILLAFSIHYKFIVGGNKNKILLLLSALLITLIFYVKSILILLSLCYVIALFIEFDLNKEVLKQIVFVAISSFAFLLISLLLVYLIYPDEFLDMKIATYGQQTLLSLDKISIIKSILTSPYRLAKFSLVMFKYPVLLFGIVSLVFLLIYYVKERLILNAILLVLLWVPSTVIIVLSNCYFEYHFINYVFSSIITLISSYKIGILNMKFKYSLVILAVLVYILIVSPLSNNFKAHNQAFNNSVNIVESIKYKYGITNDDVILYLDDGAGSYYFGNKSYNKYYFQYPLQRFWGRSDAFCKTVYNKVFNDVTAFDKKYVIVYKDWIFGDGNNSQLYDFINKNFKLAETFKIYYANHGLSKVIDSKNYELWIR